MKVHSPRGSSLTTAGWHVQTAISLETSTVSMPTSGCARVELRSSVRAGFDAASTMLHRSLNGEARRKSSFSSKLRPLPIPHSNDRRTLLDECTSHFRTACIATAPPIWAHADGPCACAHIGGASCASPQRRREVHSSKSARAHDRVAFCVSTVPPTLMFKP